jgi:hypothetical protein
LEKIENCVKISKKMKVPFYGILGLEKSSLVLYWKITDNEGNYCFEFEKRKQITRATVNGGIANRMNAYLPYSQAKIVQPNTKI